jgi:WD40 repeat protein
MECQHGRAHWVAISRTCRGRLQRLILARCGMRIVSGSADKTLRLWDAATGTPIGQPLRGHTDTVNTVAFSSNGTRIVSASDDKTLRLWDAATGKSMARHYRDILAG